MNSLMKATWIPSRGLKSIPFIKPYYPPRKGTMRSEWRSKQNHVLPIQTMGPPAEFTKFDVGFDKALQFSSQVESLKTKGFRRHYKAYEPPQDIDALVLSTLNEVYTLPQSTVADQVSLNKDLVKKAELLESLAVKTNHRVPNSFLHFLTNGQHLLEFYRTPVDMKNYYDRLSSSSAELPKNIYIQKEAIRFDPSDDHPLHKVSAYPRSSTIIMNPESKRKFKGVRTKHSPFDDNTRELDE
uniref:Large ribosomal subunit protein mL50 n=1 Tax=Lepeophtheirus salmonis TaxID=72036 RepID=A0A0K2UD89_LEPSM